MGIGPLSMAAGAGASTCSALRLLPSQASTALLRTASAAVRPHIKQPSFTRTTSTTTCADSLPTSTSSTETPSWPHAPPHTHHLPNDTHQHPTPSTSTQHQPHPPLSGRMDLIIGPMFAGKSTELLRRVRQEQKAGRSSVLVKSSKDTRYRAGHVTTHAGDQQVCTTTDSLSPLLSDGVFMMHQVIAVDEAQFFPDLLEFVTAAAEHHHKTVLVAGLDGDFQRLKFGQILDLVPLADSVTKLCGKCNYCDGKSIHSFRVVADERQELIGGGDKYVPTCRFHYVSLSLARSAKSD